MVHFGEACQNTSKYFSLNVAVERDGQSCHLLTVRWHSWNRMTSNFTSNYCSIKQPYERQLPRGFLYRTYKIMFRVRAMRAPSRLRGWGSKVWATIRPFVCLSSMAPAWWLLSAAIIVKCGVHLLAIDHTGGRQERCDLHSHDPVICSTYALVC